jgi:hypothetical protein
MHHFKWREGCLEKLQERTERYKKQGLWWWVESDAFLKFYDKYTTRLSPLFLYHLY